MGKDHNQNGVANNAHQGDHRVDTTVEDRVNDVVTIMLPHCLWLELLITGFYYQFIFQQKEDSICCYLQCITA